MDDYDRVATAIDFLIERRSEQPSLADVASRIGLSRFLTYGFARTPFGTIRVAKTTRGIAMLDFVDVPGPLDARATHLPHARFARNDGVAEAVAERAFRGVDSPVRVHVGGTNFQLRVWNALLALEPGERVSYGRLANTIGAPGSARAVGNALAVNPVCVLIPCHRVIARSGAVGNDKFGSDKKRALLAWEAARHA